jgi:hypothetical protein
MINHKAHLRLTTAKIKVTFAIWFPVNLSYALDPVKYAKTSAPPVNFSNSRHCSDVLESCQVGDR